MKTLDPIPWEGHKKFSEYTEELALKEWDEYIEHNICDMATPHCNSGEYAAEECHNGTCTAEIGRRLESGENSSNTSCTRSPPSRTTPNRTTSKSSTTSNNWLTTSSADNNSTSEDKEAVDGSDVLQPSILAISIVFAISFW